MPRETQVETGIYFIVVDGPNALLEASSKSKRSHMTQEKILNFPNWLVPPLWQNKGIRNPDPESFQKLHNSCMISCSSAIQNKA
jgi:hypothetical protein